MGVSVDHFSTSKFKLKDQEAANHIRRLINLLHYEENLYSGYRGDDFYAEMYEEGDLTFSITTGNYFDGGPQLKANSVTPPENEDDEDLSDDEYVDLWDEIQNNLEDGTHFTVTNHTNERSGLYFRMTIYHSNGKAFTKSCYEVEDELFKKLMNEECTK